MAAQMHVTQFMKAPADKLTGNVIAMAGNEHHLKSEAIRKLADAVLGDKDDGLGLVRVNGKDADLASVIDDVSMVSMWGDLRIVVVDSADDFVKNNRAALEKALEKPPKKNLLVLDVTTWQKNTRLAKLIAKIGTTLECNELSGAALEKWLVESCRDEFDKKLERPAANLMVELAGSELGLLSQELSKLVSYVGDQPAIKADDVQKLVGGWKAETTWAMTDSIRDGDVGHALACFEKLAIAGEAPQKMLGGINFVFRKLARATDLARQGNGLQTALKQAGVYPRDVQLWDKFLRRVGRPTAEGILQNLLNTDSGLKGASRVPDRIQMERLLLQLGGRIK